MSKKELYKSLLRQVLRDGEGLYGYAYGLSIRNIYQLQQICKYVAYHDYLFTNRTDHLREEDLLIAIDKLAKKYLHK